MPRATLLALGLAASGCGRPMSLVGGSASPTDVPVTDVPDVPVADVTDVPVTDVPVTDVPVSDAFVPEPACTPGNHPATGFAPLSAAASVTKVKTLLVGLGPTDEEVAAVAADPAALDGLVARWMATPEYAVKMRRFFVSTFQQDQFNYERLIYQFNQFYAFQTDQLPIVQNVQEVFGRTVMQLIAEGRPLTEALTTRRFMMTPAAMAAYAIIDNITNDDRHVREEIYQQEHPSALTLQAERAIPLEDSVNPASPDFMVFYHPRLSTPYAPGCPTGPVVYPAPIPFEVVANVFYGFEPTQVGRPECRIPPLPAAQRPLKPADFTTWRMVNIRPPREGESTTGLYDLPSFRAGGDLVIHTPRVGFHTTPAFFARWPTNNSNLARVLINQTMIVALGRPIDLSNLTAPPDLTALDRGHADPASPCYGCHVALDPMAQYFRNAFSVYSSIQTDPYQRSLLGQFGFHGVSGPGEDIADLGARLAAHPLFAAAWTQRLCTYATSAHCDENDPEFVRLVGVFRDSGHSWPALVRAMFSSPLVSSLAPTRSALAAGQPFPIARQEHLCALLSARLGGADVCGLDATTDAREVSPVAQMLASSWPSGQYSRGNAMPSLAVAPSPLTRGGMESLCADLALRYVDRGVPGGFSTADPPAAIHAIVTRLMGLTGARVAGPEAILRNHYVEALAAGVSATEALQSTFVLGCLSPFVAGVGQ